MLQEHDEIARDGAFRFDAQVFDLVDEVRDVQLLQAAVLKQPDLLLDLQRKSRS